MRINTIYDKNYPKNEIKFLNALLLNMKINDMYVSTYYNGIKLYDMDTKNPSYSNAEAIEFLMDDCLAFSNACQNDEQRDYLLEICDKYDYDYRTFCPDKELEKYLDLKFKKDILPLELSKEEEKELLKLHFQNDSDAKNKLIEHNLRLVVKTVHNYINQNVEPEDLVSIGSIGLIKGVNSYSKNNKEEFKTYLSKAINNELDLFCKKRKKQKSDDMEI